MRFIPAILTLCIAATPAVAFRAENGMIVDQTGPTEFTVASRIGRGPTEYWCAAGDYAIRVLGVPGRTAIYRVTPPPRQGGQDITFSLDPAIGTAETGISRFGRRPIATISISSPFLIKPSAAEPRSGPSRPGLGQRFHRFEAAPAIVAGWCSALKGGKVVMC